MKRFLIDREARDRYWWLTVLGGNNSGVECNLAKVEVAGSNPVSRSIDQYHWRHSQVVRQRSAKPLYTGSNPVAASNKIKGIALWAIPFFVSCYH